MTHYVAKLHGPYSFYIENNFFQAPESNNPGIYFWVLPYNENFLFNYVGKTLRTVRIRNEEHLQSQFTGKYAIYNIERYLNGDDPIEWGGYYIGNNSNYLSEYLTNLDVLYLKNISYVQSLKIFFLTIVQSREDPTVVHIPDDQLLSIEGLIGSDLRDNEEFGDLMHHTLEFGIPDNTVSLEIINRDERLLGLRDSYP